MSPAQALAIREIEIEQTDAPKDNQLAEEFFFSCNFCEKSGIMESCHSVIYERLVKSNRFYCANCIRNGFHTKRKKDILIMSFRAIFGYVYYKEYAKSVTERTIYLSEIQDFIDYHAKVGLLNPAFSYDPDTYLWFVDFTKIGDGPRQMPLDEIYKTVVNILSCFNLYESVGSSVVMHKIYDKFNEAIKLFQEKRQRPENKRLLIPSLQGSGGTADTSFPYDKTRSFLPENLVSR